MMRVSGVSFLSEVLDGELMVDHSMKTVDGVSVFKVVRYLTDNQPMDYAVVEAVSSLCVCLGELAYG